MNKVTVESLDNFRSMNNIMWKRQTFLNSVICLLFQGLWIIGHIINVLLYFLLLLD